jgi:hypothetical protein
MVAQHASVMKEFLDRHDKCWREANQAYGKKLADQNAKYEATFAERRQLHKVELETAHKNHAHLENEMIRKVNDLNVEATNQRAAHQTELANQNTKHSKEVHDLMTAMETQRHHFELHIKQINATHEHSR